MMRVPRGQITVDAVYRGIQANEISSTGIIL